MHSSSLHFDAMKTPHLLAGIAAGVVGLSGLECDRQYKKILAKQDIASIGEEAHSLQIQTATSVQIILDNASEPRPRMLPESDSSCINPDAVKIICGNQRQELLSDTEESAWDEKCRNIRDQMRKAYDAFIACVDSVQAQVDCAPSDVDERRELAGLKGLALKSLSVAQSKVDEHKENACKADVDPTTPGLIRDITNGIYEVVDIEKKINDAVTFTNVQPAEK